MGSSHIPRADASFMRDICHTPKVAAINKEATLSEDANIVILRLPLSIAEAKHAMQRSMNHAKPRRLT